MGRFMRRLALVTFVIVTSAAMPGLVLAIHDFLVSGR